MMWQLEWSIWSSLACSRRTIVIGFTNTKICASHITVEHQKRRLMDTNNLLIKIFSGPNRPIDEMVHRSISELWTKTGNKTLRQYLQCVKVWLVSTAWPTRGLSFGSQDSTWEYALKMARNQDATKRRNIFLIVS